MASCELCGKHGDLFISIIEGVKFNVCHTCKGHGKVISEYREPKEIKETKFKRIEPEEVIVNDFSELIKKGRENKNLTQIELAVKISEKDSVISKLEQGTIKPSFQLAKKLENFLHIRLIEKERLVETPTKSEKSSVLTIGDMIKRK